MALTRRRGSMSHIQMGRQQRYGQIIREFAVPPPNGASKVNVINGKRYPFTRLTIDVAGEQTESESITGGGSDTLNTLDTLGAEGEIEAEVLPEDIAQWLEMSLVPARGMRAKNISNITFVTPNSTPINSRSFGSGEILNVSDWPPGKAEILDSDGNVSEIISYASAATYSIGGATRGIDGTTARAHPAGTTVRRIIPEAQQNSSNTIYANLGIPQATVNSGGSRQIINASSSVPSPEFTAGQYLTPNTTERSLSWPSRLRVPPTVVAAYRIKGFRKTGRPGAEERYIEEIIEAEDLSMNGVDKYSDHFYSSVLTVEHGSMTDGSFVPADPQTTVVLAGRGLQWIPDTYKTILQFGIDQHPGITAQLVKGGIPASAFDVIANTTELRIGTGGIRILLGLLASKVLNYKMIDSDIIDKYSYDQTLDGGNSALSNYPVGNLRFYPRWGGALYFDQVVTLSNDESIPSGLTKKTLSVSTATDTETASYAMGDIYQKVVETPYSARADHPQISYWEYKAELGSFGGTVTSVDLLASVADWTNMSTLIGTAGVATAAFTIPGVGLDPSVDINIGDVLLVTTNGLKPRTASGNLTNVFGAGSTLGTIREVASGSNFPAAADHSVNDVSIISSAAVSRTVSASRLAVRLKQDGAWIERPSIAAGVAATLLGSDIPTVLGNLNGFIVVDNDTEFNAVPDEVGNVILASYTGSQNVSKVGSGRIGANFTATKGYIYAYTGSTWESPSDLASLTGLNQTLINNASISGGTEYPSSSNDNDIFVIDDEYTDVPVDPVTSTSDSPPTPFSDLTLTINHNYESDEATTGSRQRGQPVVGGPGVRQITLSADVYVESGDVDDTFTRWQDIYTDNKTARLELFMFNYTDTGRQYAIQIEAPNCQLTAIPALTVEDRTQMKRTLEWRCLPLDTANPDERELQVTIWSQHNPFA